MKKALIYIDFANHFNFLKKLAKGLAREGYDVLFLTNLLALDLKLKKHGLKSRLVKKNVKNSLNLDVKRTIDVAANFLPEEKAEIMANCAYTTLEKIHKKEKFDLVIVWNGTFCAHKGIKEFCVNNNVKTLFLELGNIKDKVFADPEGTNANSALYKDISILDQFNVEEKIFEKWRQDYLESKLKAHIVPQKYKKLNFRRYLEDKTFKFINRIGFCLFNIPESFDREYYLSFKNGNKPVEINYDQVITENEHYMFFPVQVSKDSQVLLNSDVDNLKAIKICSEAAKAKNLKLFVKPHPAESDNDFIEKIYDLKNKYNFYLVNNNTFELMKNAAEIVTINSTAGLEAKLLGKNVTFLGKSFYAELDSSYLKNYLLGYLIEGDYFSDKEIPESSVKKLLKRCNCG